MKNQLSQTASSYEEQLSSAASRYNTRLAATKLVFRKKLSHTTSQYQKRLSSTTASYEERLSQTTDKYETQLAQTTEALTKQLNDTTQRYEERIARASTEFSRQLQEVSGRADHLAGHLERSQKLASALKAKSLERHRLYRKSRHAMEWMDYWKNRALEHEVLLGRARADLDVARKEYDRAQTTLGNLAQERDDIGVQLAQERSARARQALDPFGQQGPGGGTGRIPKRGRTLGLIGPPAFLGIGGQRRKASAAIRRVAQAGGPAQLGGGPFTQKAGRGGPAAGKDRQSGRGCQGRLRPYGAHLLHGARPALFGPG